MNRKSMRQIFREGIFSENPLFISAMGICPALAVATQASNGFGLGIAATVVLFAMGVVLSALKRVIPYGVRIPRTMLIAATFVSITDIMVRVYMPAIYAGIGPYMPLLAVNCVILDRAEAFSSGNTVARSAVHGLAVGLGYTAGLTLLGALRELLGKGTLFGAPILSGVLPKTPLFLLAPGGMLVLGVIIAALNKLTGRNAESSCGSCEGCPSAAGCTKRASRRGASGTASRIGASGSSKTRAAAEKKGGRS